MRSYPYLRVDVFADAPFTGNPLIVFTESEALSDGEMLAITREMNLSEVTFCCPALDPDAALRIRIFTVDRELPMAGHPVVGTVFALAQTGAIPFAAPQSRVQVELGVGVQAVDLSGDEHGGLREVMLTQRNPAFGEAFTDRALLADALGLEVGDLHDDLPAQIVDTGIPWFVIPLRSLRQVRALRPDPEACAAVAERVGTDTFYALTQDTEDPGCAAHGRHVWFGPVTPSEDPVTGSAVGCSASYLVQHEVVLAAPTAEVWIEQGLEIGRPGKARALVDVEEEVGIRSVRVGGPCCFLGEGRLQLP